MYQKYFKRMFDVFGALLGLPFLLLLIIILGSIIWLEDKGSIFYNAPRLGKNGKVFKMYKFRSMKVNAPDIRNNDGSTFNSEDDPRLTKIGKFIRKTSIDETPQLLNILIGNMSFIGPRPDLPEHIKMYEGNEINKLKVRPGVTGYNQAYFRNTVSWKERITNDIYYIDNLSFFLEIKIIFYTIYTVLRKQNIYITNNEQSNKRKN